MRFTRDTSGHFECECGCGVFFHIDDMDIHDNKLLGAPCIELQMNEECEDYENQAQKWGGEKDEECDS